MFRILVFATGFDAVEGSHHQLEIRGRDGMTLDKHWSSAPSSYLCVATAGFPNLFMIFGPNSAFCNLPPGIETQVEWVTGLIAEAETHGLTLEATAAAEDEWIRHRRAIAEQSLFARTDSWIFGSNIPGKKPRTLFYFGGIGPNRQKLSDVATAGYSGFTLTGQQHSTDR